MSQSHKETKNQLFTAAILILGLGCGAGMSTHIDSKKINKLKDDLKVERIMSLGHVFEILAWKRHHLTLNGLKFGNYACRFTDEFNPAHAMNPSTPENVDKIVAYSKELLNRIKSSPQCYTFEELRLQEEVLLGYLPSILNENSYWARSKWVEHLNVIH
jgi:hypothetical protein